MKTTDYTDLKNRLHRFIKKITQIVLIAIGCWLVTVNCFASAISSDELIQNAKEYDGKEVQFQGEVIGDIMKRGNFSWVNIFDGKKAIGAFLDKSVPDNVVFTGDYNHRGDIVEVSGIFHRACLEHGGDLDIHVYKMTKLRDGWTVVHRTNHKKVRMILCLAPILFGLIVVTMMRRNFLLNADERKSNADGRR